MPTCQETHPDFCGEVTWEHLAWDLIWLPLIVLGVAIAGVMPLLRLAWVLHPRSRLVVSLRYLFGSVETDVIHYPWIANSIFFTEMCVSLWFAVSWFQQNFNHNVTALENFLEQLLCSCFLVTYLYNSVRNQFHWQFTLSVSSLITIFTVTPTFARQEDSASWFSFGFLRVYNALLAYEKLEKTGVLSDLSDMQRGYILAILRTIVLVLILAGTVFSLEILGDPPGIEDSPVTTDMGDISVAQMTYWIFTTISTVGYGDFSPSTLLSRLFIIVTIVVGVYFFSTQVNELAALRFLEDSGKGRYRATHKHAKHVVLLGGGVRNYSSVLKSLLEELYRIDHGSESQGWPDLSFISSVEQPSVLKAAIQALPRHARSRIKYFMGDPCNVADMERLRMGESNLVMIITNLQAGNTDDEDQSNILRALAIKNSYPHANIRLMLLRPASKVKAVQVGIRATRCFSVSELKSSLFAYSCVCRGWSTMVTHLLISESKDDEIEEDRLESQEDREKQDWFQDYQMGRDQNVVGFCLDARYGGRKFPDVAREAAKQGLLIIAVQVNGQILLNPTWYTMMSGDVVFAVAPYEDLTEQFDSHEEWRDIFTERQSLAAQSAQVRESQSWKHDGPTSKKWKSLSDRPPFLERTFNSQGSFKHALPFMRAREKEEKERSIRDSGIHIHQAAALALATADDRLSPTGAMMAHFPSSKAGPSSGPKNLTEDDDESNTVGHHEMGNADAALQRLLQRGLRMAEEGGHCIMVVLAGSPWQQIQAFMRTLRGKHLPYNVPILCLVQGYEKLSFSTIREVFSSVPRVAAIQIPSGATTKDLKQAGIQKARCVALLAGNAGDSGTVDRRMVDGTGVTLLCSVEAWFTELQKGSTPPIVLELHNAESVAFLHRFPPYECSGQHMKLNPKESYINQPRFASGGIFTGSCMGALLARAFYTPGIVELLEALVIGSSTGQSSFPWQMAVPPEFEQHKYGDLVQAFLADGTDAICLGLYRSCWPGAGIGAKYVMTNPPMNTVLRKDDLVILLATEAFGKDAFEKNLLVGVQGAPPVGLPESEPECGPGPDSVDTVSRRSTKKMEPVAPDQSADFDTQDLLDIAQEAQIPAMSQTQRELTQTQADLAESRDRELGLRARLREQEEELAHVRTRQAALEARLTSFEKEAAGTRTGGSRPAGSFMPCLFAEVAPNAPADPAQAGATAPRSKWASVNLPASISPTAACICRNGPATMTQTITK